MKKRQNILCFLLAITVIFLAGCAAKETPVPSASVQTPQTQNQASVPGVSLAPAPTPEAKPTPVPTPVPTASPTPTPAPTPEATPTPTPTPTPEVKPTPTPTPVPEVKPTPTPMPEPTPGQSAGPAAEEEWEWVFHEKVPILMYHEVNDQLTNSLYLSVKDFTAHLDYFEKAGITPITMQQLYDHWFNDAPIPKKPVVLTFDDGYRSMYTTVYPLLKERGWSGTFFCITDARWSANSLLEDMIAEMAANGMEIGSHTASHCELNALTGKRLLGELTESKEILADLTGEEITMLCYPAGRYNEETQSAAGETGYLLAVTTKYGFATKSQGAFELKRIRVSQGDGGAWIKSVLSPLGY